MGLINAYWIFSEKQSDGGSTPMDYLIVGCCSVLMCSLLYFTLLLQLNKLKPFLQTKSVNWTTFQTIGGFFWYIGFVVRFGHFHRGDKLDDNHIPGLLTYCNFWNFGVSILIGFSVWAGCIFLRMLRLYYIFFEETDKFTFFGLKLDFKRDWYKILCIICLPFWFIYGFILPLVGAANFQTLGKQYYCIYKSPSLAYFDGAIFIFIWLALISLSHLLREVNDDFGECVALRKALTGALSCLASILIVEIFTLDGVWFGRSIVTVAVAGSVSSFFYLQNGTLIQRLLARENVTLGQEDGMSVRESKRYQEAMSTEDQLLEGGGPSTIHSNRNEGVKFRGRANMSHKTQSMFAKSVVDRKED